jgi:predicted ABC-type ATPase
MSSPTLYVLAGPNGIGKTTSSFSIIPRNVPIINSDEIAKQVRTAELVKVNTQEYSNQEAQRLVKEYLDNRATFAIETNLSDEETWKFLVGVQKTGYRLHLIFLSTDDLRLLYNRIEERTLRGEHYVRPDVVEERYYKGLRLLKHYIVFPDVVQLIDNASSLTLVATKNGNDWQIIASNPPAWFTEYLAVHFSRQEREPPVKDLSNIEEVRQRYRQKKG